jgi:hypothetical protein
MGEQQLNILIYTVHTPVVNLNGYVLQKRITFTDIIPKLITIILAGFYVAQMGFNYECYTIYTVIYSKVRFTIYVPVKIFLLH